MAFRELTLDQTNNIESAIHDLTMLMQAWARLDLDTREPADQPLASFLWFTVDDGVEKLHRTWRDAVEPQEGKKGGAS